MFQTRGKFPAVMEAMIAGIVAGTIALSQIMSFSAHAAPNQHQSILRLTDKTAFPTSRHVKIGLNKSMMVELPTEVRDVLVSNPKMLDAVVHTSNRVYLIGMKTGEANVFFFDRNGAEILVLEVTISRDLSALADMIHRLIPGSQVRIETVNDNIVLTGTVRTPTDASRAADLASRFIASDGKGGGKSSDATPYPKVVNLLSVQAKEQVMLKVTVAEMNREVIKQLGIDASAALQNAGNISFSLLSQPPFSAYGKSLFSGVQKYYLKDGEWTAYPWTEKQGMGLSWSAGGDSVSKFVKAMERNGLIRTLAEPNLTAISGETANFQVGGEFPIPVSSDDGKIGVEWKPFGISLAFTPVVLSEGRISLKISTEVSELSSEGAITIGYLSLPGLKLRRANTTVELPSGGSLAMAGLISEDTKQAVNGIPGLKNLPVLGTLFRSRDYWKKETELVVIVTPYLVNPVARAKLVRPDDGFAPASDRKANFLGRLNRVYGTPRQRPRARQKAFGFIVE